MLLEQFDTFDKLLALLVNHVMKYCVFQVTKDMKRTVLDVAVLSLTHEARQQFPQPSHAIDDMMHVVQFRLEVITQLDMQRVESRYVLLKNPAVVRGLIWTSCKGAKDHDKRRKYLPTSFKRASSEQNVSKNK